MVTIKRYTLYGENSHEIDFRRRYAIQTEASSVVEPTHHTRLLGVGHVPAFLPPALLYTFGRDIGWVPEKSRVPGINSTREGCRKFRLAATGLEPLYSCSCLGRSLRGRMRPTSSHMFTCENQSITHSCPTGELDAKNARTRSTPLRRGLL